MKNKIIPYNSNLKEYARELRKNSTLSEVLLWQHIKQRALGVQFHRQVPLLKFIVDFYCHEIQLAIEIDGNSHEHKYDYDPRRQGVLEKQGIHFIRFSDAEIKNNMFSVGLALEDKVKERIEAIPTAKKNTPKVPSRGQSLQETFDHQEQSKKETLSFMEQTPLKYTSVSTAHRPQTDNTTSKNSKFGYSKEEKLKSAALFEKLFAEGRTISKFPLKLIWVRTQLPKKVKIQAGVSVPKKLFASAVKRNRIKRLLRESYRLNKHLIFNNIEGNFAFLFLYIGREMPPYHTIEKTMRKLLTEFVEKQESKIGS